MPRTRDLILFVVILLFLVVAIAATVMRDVSPQKVHTVAFNDVDITVGLEGTSPETDIDRQSVIDRLRSKLQDSTERIEPAASVEAPEVTDEPSEGIAVLKKCLYPDDSLSMVPKWPLSGVSVGVKEGARLVSLSETIVIPSAATSTASSTVAEEVFTTVTPLLQLPVAPIKLAESSCVPSEVVGVTNGGILMFNGDVNSYRKIGEHSLIGYARDGYPIYGVYSGEVDQCGGYEHPTGYRYTISTERDYIVGCYVGAPASFSL